VVGWVVISDQGWGWGREWASRAGHAYQITLPRASQSKDTLDMMNVW